MSNKNILLEIKPHPNFLLVQVLLFAILYSIWPLPGTIALRNACLIIGAVISLYSIYQFRLLLITRAALPIWLILALFGWMIFHFLFLSRNQVLQYAELESIWKRAAIGAIFGFGMGASIGSIYKTDRTKISPIYFRLYWVIFYFGLSALPIIFLLNWILAHQKPEWVVAYMPHCMRLYAPPGMAYLALYEMVKTGYVFFCLPALSVGLGLLLQNLKANRWFVFGNLLYIITMGLVIFTFNGDNIKNGYLWTTALFVIFSYHLIKSSSKSHLLRKILFFIFASGVIIALLIIHIEQNDSWKTLVADSKVALQTQTYSQWKYNGRQGYPINELGKEVSPTNYERISWAKEAFGLILKNPLGYGLIERSFGHLTKEIWPDSVLHQSHSGWLDLALGIGLPGIALIFSALYFLMAQLSRKKIYPHNNNWDTAILWILLSQSLMWISTEVSQKVYFDALLFWICFAAGYILNEVNFRKFSRL